jgi:NAD(P)-dependent dehydrogenase (short-subunit alcohol dehydrogenase family)
MNEVMSPRPLALVTGASSGIGEAVAIAFVEAGYDVVGTSRNSAGTVSPVGVTLLDLDVGSDDSVAALVDDVIGRFGRIDVLVNNAGIGAGGAAEESSVEQARRVFDVNFFGLIRMTKAVLPHMRAQGEGRIINVSSVLGFVPVPFGALYAASKHAVEGYSESVDHEVRQHGVRVLLVEPGFTKTSFDANIVPPAVSLAAYADDRRSAEAVLAESMVSGDEPSVVAATIVRAATDAKPKLRYPAGRQAKQLTLLRRIVPTRTFDRQIHKFNRQPGRPAERRAG